MAQTIQFNSTDITITKFARGKGMGTGYQVTWHSQDSEHLLDYVSFNTYQDAYGFALALSKRVL